MDNLTACAIAARRAGMTYGQYMAQRYKNQRPMIIKKPKQEEEEHFRTCKYCGKQFDTTGRSANALYCDTWCYRNASTEKARERGRQKSGISEDDILICPNCGISFRRGDRHGGQKYCSPECSAERARVKRNGRED